MEMYDDESDEWISMSPLSDTGSIMKAIEIPWHLAKATISRKVPK